VPRESSATGSREANFQAVPPPTELAGYLAQAPRGSHREGAQLEDRPVLNGHHVPRLDRVRRPAVPVARPPDLRPARRIPTAKLAPP
jgi:hypothetical protein